MNTPRILLRFAPKDPKFPCQIEFHRLPWKCLSPTSVEIHKHLASKYFQLLESARTSQIPLLLNDFHPEIEENRASFVLPGMSYIVPDLRSIFGPDPQEWGPYLWHGEHLQGPEFRMYYSLIELKIASVKEIWEFVSADRKILCTAICMGPLHAHCCPESTLHNLFVEKKDFVLFHFYNPNRPASELVKPFLKYFIHKPCFCSVQASLGNNLNQWSPKAIPKRLVGSSISKRSVDPASPDTYWDGIPERSAAFPGYCFGKRRDCWGMGV